MMLLDMMKKEKGDNYHHLKKELYQEHYKHETDLSTKDRILTKKPRTGSS